MGEVFDYIGRFGFYPGIHVAALMTGLGTVGHKSPQWGELYPAWLRTPLDAYLAAFPSSAPAKALQQVIFPDRYRDYMVGLELATMEGIDADAILAKRAIGEELDPDEQRAWDKALRKVATFAMGNEQIAMFRFRPEERVEAQKQCELLIEEITGLSPQQQKWIYEHSTITGDSIANYFPLGKEQYYALREAVGLMKFANVTLPIIPVEEQRERAVNILFWADVEKFREAATSGTPYGSLEGQFNLLDLDAQFLNWLGEGPGATLTGESWRTAVSSNISAMAGYINTLKTTEMYEDVPITREERMAYAEKHGLPPIVFTPMEELLWAYYQIEPERVYDEESRSYQLDWDTYWKKTDAILLALDPETRLTFLEELQKDWTPMRKLWWSVNRVYLRAYRNIKTKVLDELYNTSEQRAVLERYTKATWQEAEILREAMDEEGKSLINQFEADVRTARQNMRMLDPEMDAWLTIFGIVSKPMSDKGVQSYQEIVSDILQGAIQEPMYSQALANLNAEDRYKDVEAQEENVK